MAEFGPPPPLTEDDLLDALRRNMEDHWIGGLLEDPSSRSIFAGNAAVMLRIQEAVDENLSRGAFILTAPGRAPATSVVRLRRPLGAEVTIDTTRRFLDERGAVWRPSADFVVPASGTQQDVDVPIETERKGYFLNSFEPLSYRILDDLPDPSFVVIPGPSPATDGKTPFLDQHGGERKRPRAPGETDAQYSARIAFIEDVVAPTPMAETVIEVLDGFPITRPIAALITESGLRATREPFRDTAQPAQPGLAGRDQNFSDSGVFADDPLVRSRELADTCAFFDVEIPTPIDPNEPRLFADLGFADDPVLGFPDLPQAEEIGASLAALVDELDRRRPLCVRFRVVLGEDLLLLRHPRADSILQAGSFSPTGDDSPADLVAAVRQFDGDAAYAVSTTGAGGGAALAAGDLTFSLPAIPTPLSVVRVILRARVRREVVGTDPDPAVAMLVRPATAVAPVRVLLSGAFPVTISGSSFQEVVAVMEENPVTAVAWVPADVDAAGAFGVANAAAVGATEELRVSELTLEIIVNYG